MLIASSARTAAVALLAAACAAISPAKAAAPTTTLSPEVAPVSVDADGNLTSFLKLAVPPGIQGQQPDLGILYSSGAVNGKAGIGVKIAGLSALTRCPQTMAVDGRRGAIRFDDGDRFCLDGQRLIVMTGLYGEPGAVYRTERETWNLVASGNERCGSGPCSFTVSARDGTVRSYGGTADSRALAGGGATVRSWLLSSSKDRNGNLVTYTYRGNGERNPDIASIAYGNNPAAGVERPDRFVDFTYSSGVRPDAVKNYVGGVSYAQDDYVTAVETRVGGQKVSTYSLDYKPSVATTRLLLESVQRCAGTTCAPPITFAWQGQTETTFTPEKLAFSATLPAAIDPLALDFNGDGIGDIAAVTSDASYTYVRPAISNGRTTFDVCPGPLKIPRGTNGRLLGADLNADGLADFIYARDQGSSFAYGLYFGQPGGCTFDTVPSTTVKAPSKPDFVWAADVNGDGRTDLVAAWKKSNGFTLAVMLSDGTKLADPAFTELSTAIASTQLYLADVNGDGMMDLVIIRRAANNVLEISTALSTGARFSPVIVTSLSNVAAGDILGIWPLDVNHDGLTDLVLAQKGANGALVLQPIFAKGDGTFERGTRTTTGGPTSGIVQLAPVDTTGTGTSHFVELFARNDGGVGGIVFTPTGGVFDKGSGFETNFTANPKAMIRPMDYHGTGRAGFVQFTSANGMSAPVGLGNLGEAADVVGAVTDAQGGRSQADYKPLSSKDVYDPGGAAPGGDADALAYAYRIDPAASPFQRVGGGVRNVVSELRRTNAPEQNSASYLYRSRYKYAHGLIDLSGRGWLGFRSVTRTQMETGRVTRTSYNQAFPLTGTTSGVAKLCDGALSQDAKCTPGKEVLLAETLNRFAAKAVATGIAPARTPIYAAELQETRVASYDYGRPDLTRIRKYATDDYGNQTLVADLGVTGQERPVFTCTRFDNKVGAKAWTLGLPIRSKTSSAQACDDFDHFDDKADFALGRRSYDEASNLTGSGAYDNVNKAYLTRTFRYDRFGNRTSTSVPMRSYGSSTTTTTYDPIYHTYPETTTMPPNAAGREAVTSYGFDPRYGLSVATTDANGRTSVSCVDALGDVSQVQGPLPAAPADVRPSSNCLGPSTGGRTAFAAAPVVTIKRYARTRDGTGRIYAYVDTLNRWPTTAEAQFGESRSYLDGLGRAYMRTAKPTPASAERVSCANLAPDGSPTRVSLPSFLRDQTCTPSSGTGFEWATQTRDAYSRPLETSIPLGSGGVAASRVTYAYPGGLESIVTKGAGTADAVRSVVTAGYYDGRRKIVSVLRDADGGATTRYEYDAVGQLTSIHEPPTADNPKGVATTITYDSLGRRRALDDPDQNTTGDSSVVAKTWRYGTDGLLDWTSDAKGQTIRYASYDRLGRVLAKVEADGTTTYAYDDTKTNGVGRLASVEAAGGDTMLYRQSYGYDAYGNRASERVDLPGYQRSYSFARVFDPRGRTVSETFPNGAQVERGYAGTDLETLAVDGVQVARHEDFTPFGAPQTVRLEGGAVGTYKYLPDGLAQSETLTDAHGARQLDDGLEWNGLLDLRKVVDHLKPGGVDHGEEYGYAAGRLASASAPGLYASQSYGYSAEGNQTSADTQRLVYTAHRLIDGYSAANAKVLHLDYDADGNVTGKTMGVTRYGYTYDSRNRLKKVDTPAGPALLNEIYSDTGRRLVKRLPDGSMVFYPVRDYRVATVPGGADRATVYVTAGGRTVAQADYAATAPRMPRLRVLWSNQVRSITFALDREGRVAERFAYLPFGATVAPGGPDAITRRFQGKELDAGAGLYDFGARFYDPQTRRFATPDTRTGGNLYRSDALNRYAFALNDPVTLVDASGHDIKERLIGASIGVSEVVAGIAIDVASEGELQPVGGGLIGAGANGLFYSVTTSDFSWREYGDQEEIGLVIGVVTGALSEVGLGEAGVELDPLLESDLSGESSAGEGIEADASGDAVATDATDAAPEDDAFDSCLAGSFTAGTMVLGGNGPAPIEAMRQGALAFSHNAIDGADHLSKVGRTIAHSASDIVRLTIEGMAGREVIAVTPEHPVALVDGRWVAAGRLSAGMRLHAAGGSSAVVVAAQTLTRSPSIVYNFDLGPNHTYFAGANKILVHNPPPGGEGEDCGGGGAGDDDVVEVEVPEEVQDEHPNAVQHYQDVSAQRNSDIYTWKKGAGFFNRLFNSKRIAAIPREAEETVDEMPFASTAEGGEGSSLRVMSRQENNSWGNWVNYNVFRRFPKGTTQQRFRLSFLRRPPRGPGGTAAAGIGFLFYFVGDGWGL